MPDLSLKGCVEQRKEHPVDVTLVKHGGVKLNSEAKSNLSRTEFLKRSIPIKDHNILNI